MGDALRFAGVNKHFGEVPALRGIDFALPTGTIIGLIGDNGAGKTTLLRLAAGLLRPSSGEVCLLGRQAAREDDWLMSQLGALIETPGHYDELSVQENLRFIYSFYEAAGTLADLDDVVNAVLGQLGLASVARAAVGKLSSGYRQRLAIARALHPRARVILLDEPLVGLDPEFRMYVKSALQDRARRGALVLFSSHTLADVQRLAEGILMLIAGQLYRFGGFGDIRERLGETSDADPDGLYLKAKRAYSNGLLRWNVPSQS